METAPYTIIGGGVVGLAIAWELSKKGKEAILLEKNEQVGQEQSGRNSGVIHSGIYYQGLKAELCLEGKGLLYDFCEKYEVPCARVGKLVVAERQEDEAKLESLLQDAETKGIPARRLTGSQVKEVEPNVRCNGAVEIPSTGIIDAASYVQRLTALAKANGVQILTERKVISLGGLRNGIMIGLETPNGPEQFTTEVLINAAGLYADDIAKMLDPEFPYTTIPVKGEFYQFNKNARPELAVSRNIYPVPKTYVDEGRKHYDLGVHLTPLFESERDGRATIGSTMHVGPAVQPIDLKSDTAYGSREFTKEYFFQGVRRYFPGISRDDFQESYMGILAEIDHDDFVMEKDRKFANCTHLVGIESPGLTASLALAQRVVSMTK